MDRLTRREIELHRRIVFETLEKMCTEKNLKFDLTGHFLERFNLRSPNQQTSLFNFITAVKRVLTKPNNMYSVNINGDLFLLKTSTEGRFVCVTYSRARNDSDHFNDAQPITLVKK